ncbi:DUF6412 domain-containing protein [Rhodococcus sp. G-MC3]|uniref:DUF6412 domain-containing protein n=1 Tax=Rhodococcus sp. G-MC3 TaxID=3046209 RepID=UPI0024B90846|nr:DUF6412 domain-containing protein [Rhodococcus sp. G-MC3]MDJ0396537.1 DUF6412 domain-containing protein [Rhodococcus sp. G-MC3]
MGYPSAVLTSLLLLSILVISPAGSVELALTLVVALAALMVLAGRGGIHRHLALAFTFGPCDSERALRGSFRRQQRPDEAGRPMPRAPGAPAGAFQ